MNPQEKLEAMFCPRLDSTLVASIYHDAGDFKTSISILSALAASAPSNDIDTNIASASQKSKTNTNNNVGNSNNHHQSPANTATNKKASDSNNKNILIWSEQVASSSSRAGGLNKQGLVSNGSSFQQPISPAKLQPAGSGTVTTAVATTAAPQKSFRASTNPNYLKMRGLAEVSEPEPSSLAEDSQDEEVIEDDEAVMEEQLKPVEDYPALQAPQKQQQKKSKRTRKPKQSVKINSGFQSAIVQSGNWRDEVSEEQVFKQLANLQIPNEQPIVEDEDVDEDEDEFHSVGRDFKQTTTDDRNPIKAEELEFLKSCFPDQQHSDEYLAQVLMDSKRNLETAVEVILSQMFLDNEQVETSSTGSGSHYSSGSQATNSTSTTGSLDEAFFQGVSKSKKKNRQGSGGRGGANGFAWGANRHLQPTWDGHNDALSKTISNQDEFLIPESNEWATFEHQISILMNIFHTVPRATVVSEYHANAAHLFKTVESIEKRLKEEDRFKSGPGLARQSEFDMNLARLVDMFQDHSTEGLKKILVYNGGNLQDAVNAVFAADIVRAEQPKNSNPSHSTSKRGKGVPLQANISFANKNHVSNPSSNGNRLKSLPSTSNPFPGGPKAFPNTLLESANADLYNNDDDPIWCRERASEVLEQRNEYFRKAAKAYHAAKGKGAGTSGIAAYYADEGKKLDAQGKQLHMRAARAVVQHHRLENNDPNLVDLHGLTVVEAQTVVKEAVTQWFSRSTMQASRSSSKPLKIICGVGSHSKNRVARLFPSVLSLLMKDGWNCEAGNGVIWVKGVARYGTSSSKK
ncbi:hypothetical protein BGX27_001672 [Mortierella sp. AM989]|nr:hypothetical protein BGX27_001672 [Mortierella sp. AM989]